jgi:hypothetical protein
MEHYVDGLYVEIELAVEINFISDIDIDGKLN